jgi:ABC-type transport system involved in cytochrome c biogenesis permease subunit
MEYRSGWVAVVLYLGARATRSVARPAAQPALPGTFAAEASSSSSPTSRLAPASHSVPYRTIGGSLALFGWMLGLSYLALLFRHRERAVGPFLIPFVILFSVLGLLLPQPDLAARSDTRGTLFALHVTFAILAYAAFTFSFVLSILYLIQKRQLRRVQTGLLFSAAVGSTSSRDEPDERLHRPLGSRRRCSRGDLGRACLEPAPTRDSAI